MALSCSLCAGCSKARPSSASQSKRALLDTPNYGQRPWGCPLVPRPTTVLEWAGLWPLRFAFVT